MLRNPITGIAGCCARAASGHAAAAPPSAASNSRRPMVTVIRPSRARCVKGTIPRHERAVLHPPAHDFCFSVAEDRASGSRTSREWPQAFAKFCGITWTVAYFSGVSNGAACELEGLSSAFAGLLPHCALSGFLAQRKSEFQSDQPENGQPTEAAECRFGDRRDRLAGRHGARL